MQSLKYLSHYSQEIQTQVLHLIDTDALGERLLLKYPEPHVYNTDKSLYDYVSEIKNDYFRGSAPISKVLYDTKIRDLNSALGTHTFVSRVQGGKLKAKNEIRISHVFKKVPEPFLRMIVTHELAHLKEKNHDKAFYKLCIHIEPHYHQLEFEVRLYLTHLDLFGELYSRTNSTKTS
ncbi:MAG: M48 family metallopeptidase [Sulfuricurvum sp.]|uniref:M48 metallopeptidase family protein n=1 Tax=Sulfuricurvum sp. TaxID=2025608 RepID=UPI0025FBCE55|nr:YgjP-like metallopeptidase domain-containing protein [Sulfuricurvum sp.]MBV5321084.1 M48 family metallopeptidase [Sulfuricurvum sp.]